MLRLLGNLKKYRSLQNIRGVRLLFLWLIRGKQQPSLKVLCGLKLTSVMFYQFLNVLLEILNERMESIANNNK